MDYPASLDALWRDHLDEPALLARRRAQACSAALVVPVWVTARRGTGSCWPPTTTGPPALCSGATSPAYPSTRETSPSLTLTRSALARRRAGPAGREPPCQGVSLTGLRREADPRNQLWTRGRPARVGLAAPGGRHRERARIGHGPMREVFRDICAALTGIGYVGAGAADRRRSARRSAAPGTGVHHRRPRGPWGCSRVSRCRRRGPSPSGKPSPGWTTQEST